MKASYYILAGFLYNINIMLILLDIFYSSSYLIIRKLPLTCSIDIIYTIPL